MKRQEQGPGCPFAPGQMAADAELPGPVALNKVEQGPRKRKVRIIERETEKVLLDLAMVGAAPWVAKTRIAESQRSKIHLGLSCHARRTDKYQHPCQ